MRRLLLAGVALITLSAPAAALPPGVGIGDAVNDAMERARGFNDSRDSGGSTETYGPPRNPRHREQYDKGYDYGLSYGRGGGSSGGESAEGHPNDFNGQNGGNRER